MEGLAKEYLEELSRRTGKEVPENNVKEQAKIGREWMMTLQVLGCSPYLMSDSEVLEFVSMALRRGPYRDEVIPPLNINIPPLHKNKNKIVCIDKDKIPQEKAQWTKKDSVDLSRSLLKGLTTPFLVEEGDNRDYTEWVSKLTDDEAIEIASKIADVMLGTVKMKKESLHLIPEVTLDQLDKISKVKKDDNPEIVTSLGMSADISLRKDDDGNNVVESIKPKSFDLTPQLLSPKIKERLSAELGIGEIPDDLETQIHLCKTWLERLELFSPDHPMSDWNVMSLTTSTLTCPNDAPDYSNQINFTVKDVEEASKDYKTMTNNFNAVFGDKQE